MHSKLLVLMELADHAEEMDAIAEEFGLKHGQDYGAFVEGDYGTRYGELGKVNLRVGFVWQALLDDQDFDDEMAYAAALEKAPVEISLCCAISFDDNTDVGVTLTHDDEHGYVWHRFLSRILPEEPLHSDAVEFARRVGIECIADLGDPGEVIDEQTAMAFVRQMAEYVSIREQARNLAEDAALEQVERLEEEAKRAADRLLN